MKPKGKFNSQTLIKKNSDVQSIKTEEGIIISRANLKDDSIYYLDNPVSVLIWKLIEKKLNFAKIKERLLSEYPLKDKVIEKDLTKFISDLVDKDIVITK